MPLKRLADLGRGFELSCGDHDLRITRLPILQSGQNGGVGRLGAILDKGHAGAGEKADGLDRIDQLCGIFAQIGTWQAGQAHFLFGAGAKQGRQQLVEQMAKERQEAQAQQEKDQAPQEAPPPPAP